MPDTFLSAVFPLFFVSSSQDTTSNRPLNLAKDPFPLDRLGEMLVAGDRQRSLLELLRDDLPPTNRRLLVDRRDAALVQRDVGQRRQAALLLDRLGDLDVDGLGRLGDILEEVADGLQLHQLAVVGGVAGQLVEALVELKTVRHFCEELLRTRQNLLQN